MELKISWKRKLLFFYAISFIVMSSIVFIFPEISMIFNFSILTLTIFIIFLGSGNYIITKGNRDGTSMHLPKFLRAYNFQNLVFIKDEFRSKLYSQKFTNISSKGVEIYTFENTGRFPPAFTRISNNTPNIFIDERFIIYVDKSILEALILHELGHFKNKDFDKKRWIANIFLLSLSFSVFSLFLILILGFINQLFFIPVILISISLLSLVVGIQFIIRISEFAADRFAATVLNEPGEIIQTLKKIEEFVSEYYPEKVYFRVRRNIVKRSQRLGNETS